MDPALVTRWVREDGTPLSRAVPTGERPCARSLLPRRRSADGLRMPAAPQPFSAIIDEIDEQTLFIRVEGDANESDLDQFFEIVQPLLEERAPARVLIDAARLRDSTLGFRFKLAVRMRANKPLIDRSAIFGLPRRQESVLRVLLRLSGRSNVRTFMWRHEAEVWLTSGDLGR